MSIDKFRYDTSQSKSSYLKDPILKYIQRFFAFNFSGRKDASGTMTKDEFYFIWCMLNNVKVNVGCWEVTQFQTVLTKKNKPMILGSLITNLTIRRGVLNLDEYKDLHVAHQSKPLDLVV